MLNASQRGNVDTDLHSCPTVTQRQAASFADGHRPVMFDERTMVNADSQVLWRF